MRRTRLLLPIAAAAGLVLAWRRAAPFPARVAGRSMSPTLEGGDLVVVVRARRIRRGDVVVARRADGLEVVKRVAAAPGDVAPDGRALEDDRYWLLGDDPERSTDSAELGPFGREEILGRAIACYWPPGRVRLLRRFLRRP